jgi:hypothetical protein
LKIVASSAAAEFIRSNGGSVWVWLDPHAFVGGGYVYLHAAVESPGASRATRRYRSARRPHRFEEVDADGFIVHLDRGRLRPPQELHLALKRWPKRRVEAYWNGAVFAGDDIPPPSEW